MMRYHADVDAQDNLLQTAAHLAVQSRNLMLVQLLEVCSANFDLPNRQGQDCDGSRAV